jgi:hypothetical protein
VLTPAGGSEQYASVWRRPESPTLAVFEDIVNSRIADADEFYIRIAPPSLNDDEGVHPQALGCLGKSAYTSRIWCGRKVNPLMESAVGIRTPGGSTC